MTEAKLIKLKEMHSCLEHLKKVREALNSDNKPHLDVAIVIRDYDMDYDDMIVKGFPDFEEALRQFVEHYYAELKKAFDEA